jgi:hypothetical protein
VGGEMKFEKEGEWRVRSRRVIYRRHMVLSQRCAENSRTSHGKVSSLSAYVNGLRIVLLGRLTY